MSIIQFIINNILTQAGIILALIAMVGLIAQKKSVGDTVAGTLKTLLGFQVLAAGAGIMVASLLYFGKIFMQGFHMQGIIPSIEAINGQAMNELGFGSPIAFTFLAIFVVNLLIARFTRFKFVFLTGQALLWMATMCTVFGHYAGLHGMTLVVVGGIIGGIFTVAMPAISFPIVRRVTGKEDYALGHFGTIGYMLEAGIAKLVGDPADSVEDIKLPKYFSFLQDTYLSVMIVMVPLYLISAAFAGEAYCQTLSGNTNYLVHAFMQAIQFVVGIFVLLAGVQLILDEIVPAFRGIAMKIVPHSIPALDCPVLFPSSPNAVVVGFVTTTIGTVLAMIILPFFGMAVILPSMLANFFVGGTAGIFGNATGGKRGAVIAGVIHGMFITLLPALLVTAFDNMGFVSATATDVDTITAGLIYQWLITPLLQLF